MMLTRLVPRNSHEQHLPVAQQIKAMWCRIERLTFTFRQATYPNPLWPSTVAAEGLHSYKLSPQTALRHTPRCHRLLRYVYTSTLTCLATQVSQIRYMSGCLHQKQRLRNGS